VNDSETHGIFISYRRGDARADAGRIYDRLAARFGDDRVFMDIDDIRAGQKFMEVLSNTLGVCDVLIVLIGPSWTSAADEHGKQRLSNEDDFVRLELYTALQRNIRIVPVLVDRAQMPERHSLPPDLSAFAGYQAIEISDTRFHQDVDALIAVLEGAVPAPPAANRRKATLAVLAAGLLVAAGALYIGLYNGTQPGGLAAIGAADSAGGSDPLSLRPAGTTLTTADVRAMLVRNDFFDAEWFPGGAGIEPLYEVSVIADRAVVIDRHTGLMWQQASSGPQVPFADTPGRIAALNAGAYAGFSDWRLPTLEETVSLLSPSKTDGNAHMSPLFQTSGAPFVWTADGAEDGRHWLVYFYDGISRTEPDAFNAWVRAVRTLD
jgi:hypothetical protein